MTYASMLTNRAYVFRPQTPNLPTDDNPWGQDENPATILNTGPTGGEIPCYHTDSSGNQTVTVFGVVEQVTTEVSLLNTADVRDEDVLALDDGRNVRVLVVRSVGGNHHKLAQCRADAKYANLANPYR